MSDMTAVYDALLARRIGPVEAAPEGEGVLEIPLTNGGVMLIDACDHRLSRAEWLRLDTQGKSYAYTSHLGRKVYAHELIAGRERVRTGNGWKALGVVDHINGDGLDNRRCNLRICSHRDNMRNSTGRMRTRSSRYKGVSRANGSNAGKWRATIHLSGRQQVHLGYYKSEIEAAIAYDKAALIHFGEYARLNFPC